MKPRVAFILYRYPLGVSSMIINSIRLFVEKGFMVDIYINESSLKKAQIEFDEAHVTLIVYDDSQNIIMRGYQFLLVRAENVLSLLAKMVPIKFRFVVLFPDLLLFSQWLRKELRKYSYSYLFPVECRSLLCLSRVKVRGNIVYYNMELLDWSEKNLLYNYKLELKKLEYRMIKKLSRVVITSPLRAELFSQINDFDINKIYVLPVALMGEPIIRRSKYFREMFGIPEDFKIVVYLGNIEPWFLSIEIIQSVKDWPKGFALIMHTWNKSILEKPYGKEMINQARGLPVYFSTDYIEYDELAVALSSADIGLLFYEAIDANFTEILFSSNKFAEYLKAGLAIICSDFPSLKDFVEENRIGVSVSVEELSKAMKQIGEKLGVLKKNALVCYQEKFRFEIYFERFYNQLLQGTIN